MKLKHIFLILAQLLILRNTFSQLNIPKIFSSNMVLQRDVAIPIWGEATPASMVLIQFDGQSYQTNANKNGQWEVSIPSHKAGGNYSLIISSDGDKNSYENITFGDVWLCGGQSNMEWYVERAQNEVTEIEQADYPDIRLITVPHRMATTPQNNWEKGQWDICSPETVPKFSAVGYYFGRDLHQKLNVPIGLINNNWGGTVVQTWTSEEGFEGLPKYLDQVEELKTIDLEKETNSGDAAFNEWIADFQNKDRGIEEGIYKWASLKDYNDWKEMLIPALWEGSGDEELLERDGVVWFQKTIRLTATQAKQTAEWFFGAIDDTDKTWINGELIGETYNKYNQDRHYIIKEGVLKEGLNSIVFRVEDYVGGGGAYGDPKKCYLQLGEERLALAGSWKYKIGYLTTSPLPRNAFGPNAYPAMLYNGMIAPMTKMPIKGIVWYQGESNTYNAFEYRDLFQRLIKDWRQQFNQPNLAFVYVQLANFTAENDQPVASQWAELREAQELALVLDHTAMITTIDLGEADNIHPRNKQEVGRRLSLAALHEIYGHEEMVYQGPVMQSFKIIKGSVIVHFDPKDKLIVHDKYGYVKGFTLSGEDQQFYWAKAMLVDEHTVMVWCDEVKEAKAVRYGWADNPQPANLYNKEAFPAFPFRTDDWSIKK